MVKVYIPAPIKPINREEAVKNLRLGVEGISLAPAIHPEMVDWIAKTAEQAEWFDFGRIGSRDLAKAALDGDPFVCEGLVRLPYKHSAWRVRVVPEPDHVALEQGKEYELVLFCRSFNDASMDVFVVQFWHGAKPMVRACFILKGNQDFTSMPPELMGVTRAEALEDTKHAEDLFMGLWTILNTRNIEKRIDMPSDKLNRARTRSGKPALKPVTRVNAQQYVTALRETERHERGEGKGKELSGVRSSPRMHLRRGHIRILEKGRRTWVHPTIVGAEPGTTAVPRTEYKIHRRQEHADGAQG